MPRPDVWYVGRPSRVSSVVGVRRRVREHGGTESGKSVKKLKKLHENSDFRNIFDPRATRAKRGTKRK